MKDTSKTKAQLIKELEELRKKLAGTGSSGDTERLLCSVADNIPNSYLSVINSDYTIGLTAGQEFQRQNLDPAQFIGLSLEDVFGEHTSTVRAYYEKTFAGEKQTFELYINDQHQLYRTVPLYSDNGTIDEILVIAENVTDRRAADGALIQSEQALQEAQRISSIGSWTWSLITNEVTWSNELCRLHGLKPHEFDGQLETVMSFIDANDVERVQAEMQGMLDSREPHDFDYSIIARDGVKKFVRGDQKMVYNDNGDLIQMIGTVQDVTEQKTFDQELKYRLSLHGLENDISELFLNTLNSDLDGAFTCALKKLGRFAGAARCSLFSMSEDLETVCNTHEWCEDPDDTQIAVLQNIPFATFGYYKDLLCSHKIVNISSSEDLPTEAAEEKKWAEEHGSRSLLFVPLLRQGYLHGALGMYGPVGSSIDWPSEFVVMLEVIGNIILNVLVRKQAADELQQNEEFLSVVYDNSDVGIFVVRVMEDGNYVYEGINPVHETLVGLTNREIQGKGPDDLVDHIGEESVKFVKDLYDECVRTRKMVENEHYVTDGPAKGWWFSRITPVSDSTGRVVRLIGSGIVVTELKEAQHRERELQDKLARAERMKSLGVLAGGVAHDLNNMLGPMVVLPEMLQADIRQIIPSDDSRRENIIEELGIIQNSAERAAIVVRDLVTLSRQGECVRVPTDLNSICGMRRSSQYITDVRRSHPLIEFEQRISRDPIPILASRNHMSRAIDNLIRNAAESIKGKGRITIVTREERLDEPRHAFVTIPPGDYAVAEISDTGGGIQPEDIGRIFEPFFTKKKKSDRMGSGLGLSVVHGVVSEHEGFIDVSSEVGVGTVFTLYFPPSEDASVIADTKAVEAIHGGSESVLVVDDEPAQRYLAKRSMNSLGYAVEEAKNGSDAVAIMKDARTAGKKSPFDLIVLDMIMEQDFDGLDTLNEILKMFPDQKVIIASGHAEDGRSKAACDLGVGWLSKPYGVQALAKTIRDQLDQ